MGGGDPPGPKFIYSQILNSFTRKRKLEWLEEEEQYFDSDNFEIIAETIQATVEIASNQNFTKKRRKPRKNRREQKMFWTNGYQT